MEKSYLKIVIKYFNLHQLHLAHTQSCIFNLSGESTSLLHFKIEFFKQIYLTVLFDGFLVHQVAKSISIADLIACSTCFGHHYAHHQELKSIIQWLLPVVFRAVKM